MDGISARAMPSPDALSSQQKGGAKLSSERYIDAVLAGDALWTDIDDWIRRWHAGEGAEHELHEFLGMTWDEYCVWVEQPAILRAVIAARESGKSVAEVLDEAHEYPLAARGLSSADAHRVREWLQETGRLPS
jgi:hypothetical protein